MMSEEVLITWLMTTLRENYTGSVLRASQISDRYRTIYNASIDLGKLGRLIRRFFPRTSTTHPINKVTGRQETAYVNLEFQDNCVETPFDLKDISMHIPPSCHVQSQLQNSVTVGMPTEIIVNGNILFKRITFKDSTWNLSIRERDINLKDIGVDNTFTNTVECLRKTLEIVNRIKVCTGITMKDVGHLYIDIKKKTLMEYISVSGKENTSVTKLRYIDCEQALKWESATEVCRACRKKNKTFIQESDQGFVAKKQKVHEQIMQKKRKPDGSEKKQSVKKSISNKIVGKISMRKHLQNVLEADHSYSCSVATSDKPGEKPSKKIRLLKSKGKYNLRKMKTIKWPCGICERDCITDAVCCELCEIWYHFTCLFIDINDPELENVEWICPQCKEIYGPLSND